MILAVTQARYTSCVRLRKLNQGPAPPPPRDKAGVNVYNLDERMKQNPPSGHKKEKETMKGNQWNSDQVNVCSLLSVFDVSK